MDTGGLGLATCYRHQQLCHSRNAQGELTGLSSGWSYTSYWRLTSGVLNQDSSRGTVKVQTGPSFVADVEVKAIWHMGARAPPKCLICSGTSVNTNHPAPSLHERLS